MLRLPNRIGLAITAATLLAAALTVPSHVFFGREIERPMGKESPVRGEWVRSTFAAQYDKTCTPNGCIEWCLMSDDGPEATGILCSADTAGGCIAGTVFSPGG